MAPDTTVVDDRIEELKAAIRESRIIFWLCTTGLFAPPAIEATFIYFAVTTGGATIWAFLTFWGGLGCAAAFLFLLTTGVTARDTIITNRHSLRRSEEERRGALAGRGPTRLVVLNRYKNDLPDLVEKLRITARRYRRRHGIIQMVVVAGSLAASAVVALAGGEAVGRATAAGFSGAVAIAAAYSAYFRYKEKSLSLQSAADGIEQEHRAVHLGIGPYAGLPALDALTIFAEKIESLRSNQQRQALELDQAVRVEYQSGPSYDLQ